MYAKISYYTANGLPDPADVSFGEDLTSASSADNASVTAQRHLTSFF